MHWGDIISALGVVYCIGGYHQYTVEGKVYWQISVHWRNIMVYLGGADIISALGVFQNNNDVPQCTERPPPPTKYAALMLYTKETNILTTCQKIIDSY